MTFGYFPRGRGPDKQCLIKKENHFAILWVPIEKAKKGTTVHGWEIVEVWQAKRTLVPMGYIEIPTFEP